MYKTILVPIDMSHVVEGKANINLAAQHAVDGAKIILLNVVEEIPTWAAAQLPANIIEDSFEAVRTEMQAIANASGMKLDVEVRPGHSYNTILDVAKEKNVDLIIIASHSPGLQDYFLGSTAAKVVRHAKCSVLVVR
jgi:nucleotide-binding universal stress UspA family protein